VRACGVPRSSVLAEVNMTRKVLSAFAFLPILSLAALAPALLGLRRNLPRRGHGSFC
jgi:hypothetical protein